MADDSLSVAQPVGYYRDVHAWVLMGDPGAGKTDVFKALSKAEGGYYTTARDFIALALRPTSAEPIFIDGLDEVTAGSTGGSAVLDQIRAKLQRLGTPRFRISCREADWRGNADSAALKRLVNGDQLKELYLAPLTREQIVALVMHWQSSSEDSAVEFIRQAESHDLEVLLDNPQTLSLLIKAIGSKADKWPSSKTETYAMACAQLVQEPNEEHQAVQHNSLVPTEALLDAGGYLSAVMLLSGSAGIKLQTSSESPSGMVVLKDLRLVKGALGIEACRAAIGTRLFRGPGVFAPVHRTIAEYLGACYLASRINAGLPANRVLALMQGDDAGIVPALRGLHAWLAAAISGDIRRELIRRDPLGVVLHGDVGSFTRDEKLLVFGALRDEAKRYAHFRSQNWTSHPFGALATSDMEDEFRNLLQSPDRSEAHMALLDCVLDALAHGQPMQALTVRLEDLVRDKGYWPRLRTKALKTLLKYAAMSGNWSTLKQLLLDIQTGVVEDLEDELLGQLLPALYPGQLTATEVLQFFRTPKAPQLFGSYRLFWSRFVKSVEPSEIPRLLDALVSIGYQLGNSSDQLRSNKIVGEMLLRGITEFTPTDLSRLYGWLSLGLGPSQYCPLEDEHKTALRRWVTEHPAVYKALFEYGLHLRSKESDISRVWWEVRARLYGAAEPEDSEAWYLAMAKTCSDGSLRQRFLDAAFQFIRQKQDADAAIQMIENWAQENPNDAAWVETVLCCKYPLDALHQEFIDSEFRHQKAVSEESMQQLDFFRKTLPSFDAGPAHLGALSAVADAYLKVFHQSTRETGEARLFELLNEDADWVNRALSGLRNCLFREDIPSAAEIIDLRIKGQQYNLALPILAAMELRFTEDAATALQLPLHLLEMAVAFRLTNNFNDKPHWFEELLAERPTLVAKVLQRLILQEIAAKASYIDGVSSLAYDSDYAAVAKEITYTLATNFPLKAKAKQLENLRWLIVAMLKYFDQNTKHALIEEKLRSTGMDVAQQAYWLTVGVLVEPKLYLESIREFVAKSQARAQHVFALLNTLKQEAGIYDPPGIDALVFLIELLGPKSAVGTGADRSGWVTPEMEMRRYIQNLISALAGDPDDRAMQALGSLRGRQDMKHWADSLDRAIYDQRLSRRDALFVPASAQEVCDTLANLKPANAADLCALTVDRLTQLAAEIRNGSTNDYRQYWAGQKPNTEDVCRDALLSDLKKSLAPLGVAAEREGNYADAKRADIKVIAHPYHVPVEIKRETHPDLWTSIGAQLIAKYGRETSSDGYGIYLVFWFDGNFTAAAGDGGSKPKTPQELQQRLVATVPDALKHKIAVLVVDCAKPVPRTKA